jgi:hypothetical protein
LSPASEATSGDGAATGTGSPGTGVLGRVRPTPAELETLRFGISMRSLGDRLAVSGALFLAGLGVWLLGGFPWSLAGLVLILLGHLPLWVRPITNAPGGATPQHEEVWVPTDEDWFERLDRLERRASRWDTNPWELSNAQGCLVLGALLLLVAGALVPVSRWLGFDTAFRLGIGAAVLVVPLWLNGLRTVWQPSELRLKGEALEVARRTVEALDPDGDFDRVPMLALREGRRGKYPVDARLMLRPKAPAGSEEAGGGTPDDSGFLGVQIQVALNNVQGKDYPYLYAVVLGKEEKGFRLPTDVREHRNPKYSVRFVLERSLNEGVRVLVIRQHADRHGGWHTKPEHIREIVEVALAVGRRAWEENRRRAGGNR